MAGDDFVIGPADDQQITGMQVGVPVTSCCGAMLHESDASSREGCRRPRESRMTF